MLKLKVGESANKSTKVDGNFAQCVHTTVHKSLNDGERYQINWTLDFSKMTQEQIVEAAAEHFLIKIRRNFRNTDKPKAKDWDNVTFDCADFITARTSKVEKMAKTLADFSDEQLAALGLKRS